MQDQPGPRGRRTAFYSPQRFQRIDLQSKGGHVARRAGDGSALPRGLPEKGLEAAPAATAGAGNAGAALSGTAGYDPDP